MRLLIVDDEENIRELCKNHKLLVTMEENVTSGGFGEHIAAFVHEQDLDIRRSKQDKDIPHNL